MRKSGNRHRDDIDIAFDGDHRALLMRGLARIVMIVEQRAFVKERRLRRVQIFRLRVLFERAAAEGDDAAGAIADREHHAIAETIVRNRDIVAADQEPGLDHRLGGAPLAASASRSANLSAGA